MKHFSKDEDVAPTTESVVAEEDPAAKAKRLAELLRGRLKEQLAKGGGRDAFLSWVRSDTDKPV